MIYNLSLLLGYCSFERVIVQFYVMSNISSVNYLYELGVIHHIIATVAPVHERVSRRSLIFSLVTVLKDIITANTLVGYRRKTVRYS